MISQYAWVPAHHVISNPNFPDQMERQTAGAVRIVKSHDAYQLLLLTCRLEQTIFAAQVVWGLDGALANLEMAVCR